MISKFDKINKKGVLIFTSIPWFLFQNSKYLIIYMKSIENLISIKTRNLLIFFMLILPTVCTYLSIFAYHLPTAYKLSTAKRGYDLLRLIKTY